MSVCDRLAEFALDVATPNELAEAALRVLVDERVVAASAAQRVARVGPRRIQLTLAAGCAEDAGVRVSLQ